MTEDGAYRRLLDHYYSTGRPFPSNIEKLWRICRAFLAETLGLTFEQYSERWLKQHAEVELKPSTVASYTQLLRLYVLPRFGRLQLDAIRREQVKDFLAEWSAKNELSRNTLRLILCTLRVILNYAIEDGLSTTNKVLRMLEATAKRFSERY